MLCTELATPGSTLETREKFIESEEDGEAAEELS